MRAFPVTVSHRTATVRTHVALQLEVGNVIMGQGGWAEITNVEIVNSPATEVKITRRLLSSGISGTVSYMPFRQVGVRV